MAHRKGLFSNFANTVAKKCGHPAAFMVAGFLVFVWALTGPLFHYSDTWQLVINTTTSIITFLMVFLIQNTQSRDNHAVQLKLDELLRATQGAHNSLLCIEELTDKELDKLKKKYLQLAQQAIQDIRSGKEDFGNPDVK